MQSVKPLRCARAERVREIPRFVTGVWWRGRNGFRLDCQRGNGEKEHPRRGALGKGQKGKRH